MTDSPVGLLAWIVEKFRDWSDCEGNIESVFTKDELLTNVMLYWISASIGSSVRFYFETMMVMPGTSKEMATLSSKKVEVPTGVAMFPFELYHAPKSWCEIGYNLKRYTEFDRGGHFAAMEQPDSFIHDVKSFFLSDLAGTWPSTKL